MDEQEEILLQSMREFRKCVWQSNVQQIYKHRLTEFQRLSDRVRDAGNTNELKKGLGLCVLVIECVVADAKSDYASIRMLLNDTPWRSEQYPRESDTSREGEITEFVNEFNELYGLIEESITLSGLAHLVRKRHDIESRVMDAHLENEKRVKDAHARCQGDTHRIIKGVHQWITDIEDRLKEILIN